MKIEFSNVFVIKEEKVLYANLPEKLNGNIKDFKKRIFLNLKNNWRDDKKYILEIGTKKFHVKIRGCGHVGKKKPVEFFILEVMDNGFLEIKEHGFEIKKTVSLFFN